MSTVNHVRVLFASISLIVLFPVLVQAATLSFGGQRSVAVGSTIAIPVVVSTAAGETMNAVSATINFPQDKLRVVSVDDSGIINLWAEKPSFSNANGTVSFQGVVYNPGYSGANGRVVLINFRAVTEGDAALSFSDRSILANDGEGTEILTGAGTANISIQPAPRVQPKPEPDKTPESTGSTTTAEEVPADAAPVQAVDQDHVIRLVIPYGFLIKMQDAFAHLLPTILVILGLAGWLFFFLWFFWHRLHSVRRSLLKRLAATDSMLHAELAELHRALEDEVSRLEAKEKNGTLTAEEQHILERFSEMLENMTTKTSWHLEAGVIAPTKKGKRK